MGCSDSKSTTAVNTTEAPMDKNDQTKSSDPNNDTSAAENVKMPIETIEEKPEEQEEMATEEINAPPPTKEGSTTDARRSSKVSEVSSNNRRRSTASVNSEATRQDNKRRLSSTGESNERKLSVPSEDNTEASPPAENQHTGVNEE